MGEHVSDNFFCVRALTIQKHSGAFASFVRLLEDVLRPLAAFFRVTGHNYRRYNYLGEWHSHPSFALKPSQPDIQTMRDIVDDPAVGANFVVLLIVKLDSTGALRGAPFVFPVGRAHYLATLEIEHEH